MSILTNHLGQSLVLTKELGRGGEGTVFTVANREALVAKVYHPAQRTAQREEKLRMMVDHPPRNAGLGDENVYPSLAWPHELLYEGSNFVGFTMPRMEHCPTIFEVYNPKLRARRYPTVDRRFLHHAARNLALVLATLHASGYVMGDVNQKNILINPKSLITLVDTDSFQVGDGTGKLFRCTVGVPEYTAPELHGKVLAQIDRSPLHDCFGMSVLLFQLLMEGYHPFTGRPISTMSKQVSQLSVHCIQWGIFPYQSNHDVQPPPGAPNFAWLHPELQRLFVASFLLGHLNPANRPNALAWARGLRIAEEMLLHCTRNPAHWYSRHLDYCPYCGKAQFVTLSGLPRPQQAWQRQETTISTLPINGWQVVRGVLLPLILVIGIPLLWWMFQAGTIGLLIPFLAALVKFGLLKRALRLASGLLADTAQVAKAGWHHLNIQLDIHMKIAIILAIGVIGLFVTLALRAPMTSNSSSISPYPTLGLNMTQLSEFESPLSPLAKPQD